MNIDWPISAIISLFLAPDTPADDVVRLMCASLVPLDSVLTKVAIGGTSVRL